LNNPVLLILSVPNNSAVPSATSASLYAPYPDPSSPISIAITAGTAAYGIKTDSSGFAGLMSSGDVYTFLLGKTNADNSNSFTNYSAAVLRALGLSVSDFGIYVFSIDTSAFAANDLLDITLDGLPEGTFAIAYGEDSKNLYDTPFTEAGMVDVPPAPIPEPPSWALLAAGLFGLVILRRRAALAR
jgi:PEP-CTERM motif